MNNNLRIEIKERKKTSRPVNMYEEIKMTKNKKYKKSISKKKI